MTKQLQRAVAMGVKTNLGISAQKVQFKRPITAELRQRAAGIARSENASCPKRTSSSTVGHPRGLGPCLSVMGSEAGGMWGGGEPRADQRVAWHHNTANMEERKM